MKILAFMNAYSQGKSGSDVFFVEVAKRLEGYDRFVVTSLLGKEFCQKSGLVSEYLITTRESKFQSTIPTYTKRIVKALFLGIKVEEGDILLGTSDFLPDVLPIFWLKIRNKKTRWVQHIFHLIPSSRRTPFFAQRISLRLIKRFADVIIVDNSLLKNELTELGFNPQKIFVSYPGIDLDYLRSVGVGDRRGYDGIFMARLHPSKGIFDLVKIWRLVRQKQPGARLGIIGKGSTGEVSKLKSLIEAADLGEGIDLIGYLENDAAFATIKASKVFVFPSHEEGFGIAPLEAQALGLPVVAWDLPVYREVFPQGMVRVEVGDVEKFAVAVLDLLTNSSDYEGLSGEAVANASRFEWDAVAEKERALIENG